MKYLYVRSVWRAAVLRHRFARRREDDHRLVSGTAIYIMFEQGPSTVCSSKSIAPTLLSSLITSGRIWKVGGVQFGWGQLDRQPKFFSSVRRFLPQCSRPLAPRKDVNGKKELTRTKIRTLHPRAALSVLNYNPYKRRRCSLASRKKPSLGRKFSFLRVGRYCRVGLLTTSTLVLPVEHEPERTKRLRRDSLRYPGS